MTFKNMLAGVAALGLATAPVAATAGTRAADALPTLASSDISLGARTTETVRKDERLSGGGAIYAGLFALGFAALLYFAIDDDDDFDRTD